MKHMFDPLFGDSSPNVSNTFFSARQIDPCKNPKRPMPRRECHGGEIDLRWWRLVNLLQDRPAALRHNYQPGGVRDQFPHHAMLVGVRLEEHDVERGGSPLIRAKILLFNLEANDIRILIASVDIIDRHRLRGCHAATA
jgi:hypothetical protein